MKIGWRIYWLPLLVVGLMAILSPCRILAQAEKIDLTLRLVSAGYYNRTTTGKHKTIFLKIVNTCNKAIANIRVNADKPEGWIVELGTESMDYLSPGSGFEEGSLSANAV